MSTVASDDHLVEFWTAYEDEGRRGVWHLVRHPVLAWRAFRTVRALPTIDAHPSDSTAGRAIAAMIDARGPLGLPARMLGSAALEIPDDPEDYLQGRRAQTLRRKIRAAEKRGISVRPVTDPAERDHLLALANHAEQTHPDATYRVADPRNDDLLDHDLWQVATAADGEPLLLCVIPVDGDLSLLRYCRTLGRGPAHSDSRYLMNKALVERLSERGVRWLLDTESPGEQTNGLRHFQRMVGFRYVRLRPCRGDRQASGDPALSS